MATTQGDETLPRAGYDLMRQFAELAGDVRDPYPMLAGLRETTPVAKICLELATGQAMDAKAPLPPLYTVHRVRGDLVTGRVPAGASSARASGCHLTLPGAAGPGSGKRRSWTSPTCAALS